MKQQAEKHEAEMKALHTTFQETVLLKDTEIKSLLEKNESQRSSYEIQIDTLNLTIHKLTLIKDELESKVLEL